MISGRHKHGHAHAAVGHGGNARRIFWALLLIGGFTIVEVIGGVISGSLALLADAAHMLIDTVALLVAWIEPSSPGQDPNIRLSPVSGSRSLRQRDQPVHAWSLSQDRSLLTLHARIAEDTNPDSAVAAIRNRLATRFDVDRVTVQIELEGCADDPMAASG